MKSVKIKVGESPLVVAAIHNGHAIRPELLPFLNLTEEHRLREEDPFTTEWLEISDSTIKVTSSRFEVDINRPRDKCIYLTPKDAWGLKVWNKPLPDELIQNSLQLYDKFYENLEQAMVEFLSRHERLVIYDIHSYNFRREGPDEYGLPEENPEINVGTGNLDREMWKSVIDELIAVMSDFNFEGRHLDVRENVKFSGGHFSRWLNEKYGNRICVIAIEVKKFFMDEWTGDVNAGNVRHIRQMLIETIQPVLKKAAQLKFVANAK